MLIFALDSSATAASSALVEDGKILSENYLNIGLKHSETLGILVDNTLKTAGKKVEDIDLFAVTHGPGSFTGIRIGVSLIKGLAAANDTPCFGVSALEAIAYPLKDFDTLAVSVMDARCKQVYNAIFENGNRLCDDRAISIDELAEELKQYNKKITLIGDGAEIVYNEIGNENIVLANPQIRFQRASSAALLAEYYIKNTDMTPKAAMYVNPVYLRKPQAERMRGE
jgi:tRNA threonylcarbamoyladenosine biosynthesis protein TsaB